MDYIHIVKINLWVPNLLTALLGDTHMYLDYSGNSGSEIICEVM